MQWGEPPEAPSPLEGEGWGGGCRGTELGRVYPSPNPSHKGRGVNEAPPQTIRVRIVPTPSTVPSSTSPRWTAATPSGVPE